jgi:hypothetical protein
MLSFHGFFIFIVGHPRYCNKRNSDMSDNKKYYTTLLFTVFLEHNYLYEKLALPGVTPGIPVL